VSGANGKLTDQQVEAELADLAAGRNVPSDGDGQAGHTARTLRVRSIREVLDELQTAGQRTWLSQRLWPGDAYGVLGAQDKAGKTWGLLDLAVSVASGTPWLGRFPCPAPGPVTLFLGEGGMPGTVRRLRAVTEHKGLDLAELALRLEFKAPNLGRAEHLRFIAEELAAHPPRLLGLDPSYLTTGGRSGTNLNEMGELLASVQALCEDAAAALVVNVHWNKTGTGTGAERFTGVGPSAWGRVLGSASVEQSSTEADGKTSNVTLGWEFKGGEIADATFRMRRRVWADDPDDLNSPLHYQAEVTTEGPHRPMSDSQDGDGLGFAQRRVVADAQGRQTAPRPGHRRPDRRGRPRQAAEGADHPQRPPGPREARLGRGHRRGTRATAALVADQGGRGPSRPSRPSPRGRWGGDLPDPPYSP
jgi:AAA domain